MSKKCYKRISEKCTTAYAETQNKFNLSDQSDIEDLQKDVQNLPTCVNKCVDTNAEKADKKCFNSEESCEMRNEVYANLVACWRVCNANILKFGLAVFVAIIMT